METREQEPTNQAPTWHAWRYQPGDYFDEGWVEPPPALHDAPAHLLRARARSTAYESELMLMVAELLRREGGSICYEAARHCRTFTVIRGDGETRKYRARGFENPELRELAETLH